MTLESADTADETFAPDNSLALDEYSFNGQDGSPEGSIFATDVDEACALWALESLSEYGGGIYSVWGPDCEGREYSVERSGAEVVAKPWEADVQ